MELAAEFGDTTQQVDGRMIVLSDTGFHAAEGDPSNLKLCQRGEWQDRMLVETVLSMLTLVCHLTPISAERNAATIWDETARFLPRKSDDLRRQG
jgi:hypothetical protein